MTGSKARKSEIFNTLAVLEKAGPRNNYITKCDIEHKYICENTLQDFVRS